MKRSILAGIAAFSLGLVIGYFASIPAEAEIEAATPTTTEAPTTTVQETTTTTAPTTTTTEPTTTTTAVEPSDDGTFDNPAEGETLSLVWPEWEVSYKGAHISSDEVMAENQFNDPPAEGMAFVTFTVEAAYNGTESDDFWWSYNFAIVGKDGNTFDESCGVIANDLSDAGEVYPGATVSGDECYVVPVDQIEGAKLMIKPLFADEANFFWLDAQ